jgi:MscS family membrane protein
MEFWNDMISWINNQVDYQRYLLLGLLMVILVIFSRLVKKILSKLSDNKSEKDKPIFSSFLDALAKSSTVLFVMVGLIVILNILQFPARSAETVDIIIRIVTTLGLGFFAFQLTKVPIVWFEQLLSKDGKKSSKMFVPVLRNVIGLIVVTFVIAQIIQIVSGKTFTAVIAGLGIGSLAIALAAQDTLKHFIGSFVIAGDKPAEIGERVVVDGHDGMVEKIGLRSTAIRTLDGHLVIIPNGELANRTIQNIGKRPFIRRVANITITYDTPPEKINRALEILKDILKDHEGMDPELPPRVFFDKLNADSLNILMIYWYHPPDYWQYLDFTQRINLQIIEQFNAEGIDFAFPTQTVYVAGDKKRPLDDGLMQLIEGMEGKAGK